jgi:uncharacterized protein HemX
MALFSHSTLSRVVAEAAVRFAWLLDTDVSSEERVMRGAVALLVSADERLKGSNGPTFGTVRSEHPAKADR